MYAQIVERTLQLEGLDGVVFLHTSLGTEHETSRVLLERVIELVERYDKPVAFYVSTDVHEASYLKQNYNFPVFTQVVETIRALEMNHRYHCQFQRLQTEEEIPTFEVDHTAVQALVDRAKGEERDLLLSEAAEMRNSPTGRGPSNGKGTRTIL